MNKQLSIILAVLFIFLLGTAGYVLIEEDWTLFEAFYMTVITITTVGYGETRALSAPGRLFTVFLIFIGLGTAAVFATSLAKAFLENNLKSLFGANKMKKKIDKLKQHYIVCGYGDIGSSICSTLDGAGIPFVLIEADKEKTEFALQHSYLIIQGKATYDSTLFQAGILNAKGMVVCLGDDSENLYVTLAAREINPNLQIIVRGYNTQGERRIKRAGADSVVYPLRLGGEQVAKLIVDQFEEDPALRPEARASGSVMGYSLRKYVHYSAEETSVKAVAAAHAAGRVVSLIPAEGPPEEFPPEDRSIRKNDSLLVLIKGERADEGGVQGIIPWLEDYSLGIPEVDEEHRKLLELINVFLEALNRRQEKEILTVTFDNLIEYTCIHFRNEEKLFKEHGYPHQEAHIREHRRLTEKVRELNKERNCVFPGNIAEFLSSWITDHILQEDKAFAYYLKKEGLL